MYDITSFGAIADNMTVNTVAIQSAIDACSASGGGLVNVPTGSFITGTIYLKSNVELHLQSGAELKASLNVNDYNDLDAYPENFSAPDEKWEGRHLIIANRVKNVSITGFGKISGSADEIFEDKADDFKSPEIWCYGLSYQKNRETLRPGQTVVFIKCKDISITDITIVNSPAWCLFFHGCENVQIRGYKAFNERSWANTDGLDIDTCKNVTVSDCIIDTGDDAIAIRCDSKQLNSEKTTCENITITNCVLASSSSVFRFGVGIGEIRNIIVSHIIIPRGGIAFDISTHFSSRGHACIEDVKISDIIAKNISRPLFFRAYKDCYIKNISICNFLAECFAGVYVAAEEEAEINNILVRDMSIRIIPTPFKHPILKLDGNNYLFEFKNSKGIKLENINAQIQKNIQELFKKIYVLNSDVSAIEFDEIQ